MDFASPVAIITLFLWLIALVALVLIAVDEVFIGEIMLASDFFIITLIVWLISAGVVSV